MKRFVGACVTLAAVASGAWAQERISYSSLLGSGYEIRSVTLMPVEAVNRLSANTNIDAVVVTLQRGNTSAVCYIGLSSWLNQDAPVLDNKDFCARR